MGDRIKIPAQNTIQKGGCCQTSNKVGDSPILRSKMDYSAVVYHQIITVSLRPFTVNYRFHYFSTIGWIFKINFSRSSSIPTVSQQLQNYRLTTLHPAGNAAVQSLQFRGMVTLVKLLHL